jgi:PAS domain S-box-containing protein
MVYLPKSQFICRLDQTLSIDSNQRADYNAKHVDTINKCNLINNMEKIMAYKILVVDDEENIRFTFDNFLTNAGYEVVTAQNLTEGMQQLDNDVDLIFLDILLGTDNGLALLREVKERGLLTPVVMITGSPEVETAAEALRYGAYDYIPKPILQETLLRVADKALAYSKLLKDKETMRMRLEGLFRCAAEGIIITDSQLKIAELNAAAKRIFGCDDSIIGSSLEDLSEDKRYASLLKFSDMIKSRFSGEIYQLAGKTPDGADQMLSLTASPLTNEEGVDYGYILVVREEPAVANAI